MRAELQLKSVEVDSIDRQLLGLSDMEIVTVGARRYLLAAGAADGGISSYEILADGSLVASDDILPTPNSGTSGVSDLTVFASGGVTYVLGSGKSDNNQVIYELDSAGNFSISDAYFGAATFGGWQQTTVSEVGGNLYLFGSIWAQSGYFRFGIETDGDLINPVLFPDTPTTFLGDVTAIHAASLRGNSFLFVASGVDNGLHSYFVSPDGGHALIDTAYPVEGGFSGVTSLIGLDVGGRSFLVMGAAGADSLLVFRVSSDGKLNFIDKLVDTAETRFAGVQALEVFEYNGRSYLLAGGADDGITLLEITYKGELRVVTTVVDTAGTSLQNVTDIEAVVIGGELNVFVSSATDHGFTQFVMVVPNAGVLIRGGTGNDTLTGGAGDDTIFGHGHNDNLYGMDGDDRLIDGRGSDHMWGGAGADVFEFVCEEKNDYIMDFEIGVDRIDLSDYPLLYHYSSIGFTATADGAILQIGTDYIYITSMDNTALTEAMFSQDDFIFG